MGSEKRIPVSEATRDEILKPRKRGDDTYDDVIRRMAGDGEGVGVEATVTPTLDEDAVDEMVERIEERLTDEVAVYQPGDDEPVGTIEQPAGIDPDDFAREVARQMDYVAIADSVAEQVARELQG